MKISDFFTNLFGNKVNDDRSFSVLKPYNTYNPRYLAYSNREYDNVLYRACIDRIAQQIGKLTPIIKFNGRYSDIYQNLSYLLKQKPNEYMNRFEFFYKITSMLYDTNNCFIYVRIVDNIIVGFYPVNYTQIELVEFENEIFAKFSFSARGKLVYIPLDELIVLRRHYNENELFGDSQKDSLKPIFEVIKAIDSGLINSVESSSQLRGIIKYTGGGLRPEDLKAYKENFVNDYMTFGSGIGILDNKCDFTPIEVNPKTIDSGQQKITLDYLNYNFGVSEAILKGEASEDEYNAFYELVIEPFLIQLSLEFTNKVFTKFEIEAGNKILFTANKLLFANVSTKTTMLKELMSMGIFSINEGREIFGLEPIENGNKHILSLNYIDLKKANKYQVGEEDNNGGEDNDRKE